MSKSLILLTGLLLLGSMETSQSHPLDSPDIVYIDGLPCNRACQSWMAWSWRSTPSAAQRAPAAESPPVGSPPAKAAAAKPAHRPAKNAVSRAAAMHRENSKPAKPRIAKPVAPLPPAEAATPQPAAEPAVNSEPAPAKIAASPSADDAAAAAVKTRSVQEQVAAATALAEQVTAASAAPPATNAETSVSTGTGELSEAGSAAAENADNRVALVVARPEIESVSELAGKEVAIEEQQSASSASIRAAIASAGATEVQLDEKSAKPIDRLIGGEVPAAVVALVSPQAAEWFPEIPGYRIFRIPLAPGAVKARL